MLHFSKPERDTKKGLKIIIVGCGKVGATLIEQLSKEGHDITIIDKYVLSIVTEQLSSLKDKIQFNRETPS